MKNYIVLLFAFLIVGLSSCSKDEALSVSDQDIEALRAFADQAEDLAPIVDQFSGDANEIFDVVVFSVDCNGGGASLDIRQEGQNLLTELLRLMDFQSSRQVHDWVVKNGKLMYDIRKNNRDLHDSDRDFIHDLACLVVPEIETRNLSDNCYKNSVVDLFRDALKVGGTYGIRFNKVEDQRVVTEVTCVARGSALNRLWNFMNARNACEG